MIKMRETKAKILVCDPQREITGDIARILFNRFDISNPIKDEAINIMTTSNRFESRGVDFTIVDTMPEFVDTLTKQPAPSYSLAAYHAPQIKKKGAIGFITDVRKYDFFLPQMIIGEGLRMGQIAQSARAGVHYFSSSIEESKDQLHKIFHSAVRLANGTVVKIGGSSFDFDRQVKDMHNLETLCQILIKIHQDRSDSDKKRRAKRIVVTAGAGQNGDIDKEFNEKYIHNDVVTGQFPLMMAEDLQLNLKRLKSFFGNHGSLLNTGAFYYVNPGSTSKRIPLIGTAPHYIMVRKGIPLQDSDTHTLAIAEYCKVSRVVLVKRTDGIYNFDPYRGFTMDPKTFRCADYGSWRATQQGNKRYETVNLDEMIDGTTFSREGTSSNGMADGSTGHLMEDSALRYMRDHCRHVKEIVVVHIAPEEMHERIGENKYRHIITGEEILIDPATGWKGIVEQRLRDALEGKAFSKIIKQYPL